MVSDLLSYGPDGNPTECVEAWDFTDEKHHLWKLHTKTPDGPKEVMGGTYSKEE
jgi:hypothetical protein